MLSKSGRPRRRRRSLHRKQRLSIEVLESRRMLDAGQWLVKFVDIPGDTRDEQLPYIQGLLHEAGLDSRGLQAVEHEGVDGVVLLQAPVEQSLDVVEHELRAVPGFASVESFDDDVGPAERSVYVPESPFGEFTTPPDWGPQPLANEGALTIAGRQFVAGIDGSGLITVSPGATLTADHIVQGTLVIGGTVDSTGRVTIASSDANGNPIHTSSTAPTDSSSLTGNSGPASDTPGGAGTSGIVQGVNGFNGINATNNPSSLSPPDSDGAVGPNSFIEAVNVSLAIYNKTTGTAISGGAITPFSTFFSSLGVTGVTFSDPICVYNDVTQQFGVGILDFHTSGGSPTDARLDFAISKTSNPTLAASDWTMFRYNTNDGIGATLDFSDYPKLGYNADGYVVSVNMFPSSFDHVSVLGIRNNGTSTGMRQMPGGFTNFTLAPASMHGAMTGAPMWFLGDGHSGNGGSTINVVRLDNPFSTAAVVSTSFPITVATFANAPNPRQPGGTLGGLDSGFTDRTSLGTRFYFSGLRTVAGVTHLVSAHAVGNGTGVESRWYDVNVSSGTPALIQQGKVNPNPTTIDTYFPDVDISSDGSIGMNYSESGTTEFMSMYVTGRRLGDAAGSMETSVLAHSNATGLHAFGRAGDYSFTSVDPNNGTFWTINEYAASIANPNWGTWIQHFTLGGLAVVGSTPAVSSIVATPPSSYAISFSDPIDPASLQASDLTVNSSPATNVVLSADDKSATFTFATNPVTAQGLETMAMAAGAVAKLGDPATLLTAFSGAFRFDALTLQVTSTNPPAGSVLTLPGPLTLDVNFNEPISPASVTTNSLSLSGIAGANVTAAAVLPGNTTAEFTIGGITTEGTLTASIAAGGVTDQFGNSGNAFSASYTADFGVVPFPTPLASVAPAGSLIYSGSATGLIAPTGDIDGFTLAVDPGQTISVLVSATSASLQPTVQLLDPMSAIVATATAAAAGQSALLQAVPTAIATSGIYTIFVGGAGGTSGGYSVQVTLNAALEAEAYLPGAGNDTLATAQPLDGSFINLNPSGSASRAAIVGNNFGINAAATTDFESGQAGYVVNNAVRGTGASAGLWHLTTRRGTQSGHSQVTSFYYGSETTGTYNSGAANAGWITSPVIALPASGPISLSFNYVLQTEGGTGFDTANVLVSSDGFATSTTVASRATNLLNVGAWTPLSVSLASFAGKNIQIRFAFDTVDSVDNAHEGWYVDDVSVSTPTTWNDYYSVSLSAGDLVTVGLKNTSGSGDAIALLSPSGTPLAAGASGAGNLDQALNNFAVLASGQYFVRVSGQATASYDLVLTRNAAFDTEPNGTSATAQSLDGTRGALGSVAALSTGGTTTLTFDELPTQPVNGLTFKGVTFGYTVGGVASTDARYDANGPGVTAFTQDPSLEGGTSGVLTFNFANAPVNVTFGLALSTGAVVSNAATVALYSPNSTLISTTTMSISPLGFAFSSSRFTYSGPGPVGSAVISFNGAAAARFVVDNLTYALPSSVDDWFALTVPSASNVVNLATTTPAGGPGEFVNTLVPKIELYNPSGTLVANGVVGADGRNQSLTYLAPAPGVYRVRVYAATGSQGEYFLNSTVSPLSTVQSITIDDGTVQRSRVRSITLTVGGTIVSAPASAFHLVRTEDGVVVPVVVSAITLTGGQTKITLAFSDPSLEAGSLSDGHYTVTIDGSQLIDGFGRMVDAAGTGVLGSSRNVAFIRFFGDANGDGFVDANDYLAFHGAYLTGDATGLNSAYDYDGDGQFTTADLQAFTDRLLKRTL